jgi:hypothetical protein
VVFGARGVCGKEKGREWVEYYLQVLLGRRGREEEQARARDTAAARWQSVTARVAVVLAGKDSRGGEQDQERGRATRGVRPSRRWRRGGVRAAVGGADNRRQRVEQGSRGIEGARGRGREEGVRRTRW